MCKNGWCVSVCLGGKVANWIIYSLQNCCQEPISGPNFKSWGWIAILILASWEGTKKGGVKHVKKWGRVLRQICQSLLSPLWVGQGFASTIYNVMREFQYVFFQFAKCICLNVFVKIVKLYLSKLPNVFIHIEKCWGRFVKVFCHPCEPDKVLLPLSIMCWESFNIGILKVTTTMMMMMMMRIDKRVDSKTSRAFLEKLVFQRRPAVLSAAAHASTHPPTDAHNW